MHLYTESNLSAFYAAIGALADAAVLQTENWRKICLPDCAWPRLYFNLSFPAGEAGKATGSLLEQLAAPDAPGVVMCRTDASAETLQSLRGYALAEKSWAAMSLDLDTFGEPEQKRPRGLKMSLITEKQAIIAWCKVVGQALVGGIDMNIALFEKMAASPRFRFLLATVNQEAVASCLLFFHEETVGLYLIGTLPGWQGKGFGTALTAFGLKLSKETGARLAHLQATPAGEPVYARLGFQKAGEHAVFRLK